MHELRELPPQANLNGISIHWAGSSLRAQPSTWPFIHVRVRSGFCWGAPPPRPPFGRPLSRPPQARFEAKVKSAAVAASMNGKYLSSLHVRLSHGHVHYQKLPEVDCISGGGGAFPTSQQSGCMRSLQLQQPWRFCIRVCAFLFPMAQNVGGCRGEWRSVALFKSV